MSSAPLTKPTIEARLTQARNDLMHARIALYAKKSEVQETLEEAVRIIGLWEARIRAGDNKCLAAKLELEGLLPTYGRRVIKKMELHERATWAKVVMLKWKLEGI
ncbi:hypothetical protein G7Y79_00003g012180 [Physcia stellaris]|nr:hypothetical protein G7Y79_00003g012180 [Physcia stellaris]